MLHYERLIANFVVSRKLSKRFTGRVIHFLCSAVSTDLSPQGVILDKWGKYVNHIIYFGVTPSHWSVANSDL